MLLFPLIVKKYYNIQPTNYYHYDDILVHLFLVCFEAVLPPPPLHSLAELILHRPSKSFILQENGTLPSFSLTILCCSHNHWDNSVRDSALLALFICFVICERNISKSKRCIHVRYLWEYDMMEKRT